MPRIAPRASHERTRLLYALLALALLVRLATLALYPLTDNTEARYAEIARKMIETGDWTVPQIGYGVPFWGKPPLSMWLTALSCKVLGVNAFAARLPSLLLGVAVCWLVYRLGMQRSGKDFGLRASLVVGTSALMFVSAGGVMTDPAMLFGVVLSMVGYWLALTTGSRPWGWLFFVGLAIGLLAKGPVAVVLTLLPIGIWALATRRVAQTWQRLPWFAGCLLVAALVLPWYLAMEMRSPGFLRYFIIGEHLERFLMPGWKGDLYGMGHEYPRGTIWLYALLGTLPWSPWLIRELFRRNAASMPAQLRSDDGWLLYLVCWMLAPAVFFTLSRNILPTYYLPGLAGFGLLVAHAWQAREAPVSTWQTHRLALLAPSLALLLLVAATNAGFQSQQEIVATYRQQPGGARLTYFRQRPCSAEFYSRGKADRAGDAETLRSYLKANPHSYVATEADSLSLLPNDLRRGLVEVTASRSGKYVLLWDRDGVSACGSEHCGTQKSGKTDTAQVVNPQTYAVE